MTGKAIAEAMACLYPRFEALEQRLELLELVLATGEEKADAEKFEGRARDAFAEAYAKDQAEAEASLWLRRTRKARS